MSTGPDAAAPQPFADERGSASAHLPPGAPPGWWRLLDRLVAATFAAVILVGAGLLAAGVRPAEVENRPLRTLPPPTIDALVDGSWARAADAFLADNLAARPYALRLRGLAYWAAGGTGNPEVVRGLEGWLFIRGEFEPACRFNTEAVAGSLARAAEAFARARQSFRFLLVPDKHTVYPDRVPHQLPFGPPCGDGGRLTTSAVRAAGAAGIDAAPLLVAARGEADPPRLYYATDSHWTPSGAIVAIGALVGSIDPEVWATAAVRRDGEVRRRTDLPTLLGLRRVEETPRLRVREGVRIETIDVEVPAQIHNARGVFRVVARGDAPLIEGRTIIVYDSFFGISVPLVAPFFADSTWVHVGDLMNQPELGRFLGGFDTVILERVERGVYETDFGAVLGALVRGGS